MVACLIVPLALLACGGGGSNTVADQTIAAMSQGTLPQALGTSPEPTTGVASSATSDSSTIGADTGFAQQAASYSMSSDTLQTSAFAAADPVGLPADAQPAPTVHATAVTAAQQSDAGSQVSALVQSAGIFLPVRAATEDWDNARRLALNDRGWQAWVAARHNLVNKWFAIQRDRPALIAGYPNDLVDATTGVAVAWSMDMPEPVDGGTAAAVKFKQAWAAITRQYNISRTVDAARLFALSGDTALAETAAKQLDFYAENYAKWPLRTAIGNARMLGQSLDEASSVLEMLEAAKALRAYVAPQRYSKWNVSLFTPIGANLQTYSYGPLNNINLWCAAGVAAIGLHLNDQTLIDLGTTGPKGMAAVLAQGVTKDGIWFEGSFGYNNYVVVALARFFDLAAASGRPDLVTTYAADVQRLLLAPILFRFDDGTLPTPSDTRSPVPPVDKGTHLALYRHVPTTFGLQAAAASRSWSTLLDPPSAAVPLAVLPPVQSIHAAEVRMLQLRKGDWQLFVHYGQKTINHAQEEALTYELAQGVTSITRDAGTATSYSSLEHLEYFSKGVGNNVPLIDGMGQEQWALGNVITFDTTSGIADLIQPMYRHDVSARRTFKLAVDGMTETTRITLTTPQAAPRRLGVMFNTACSVGVQDPRAGVASASTAPTGGAGFKHWTNIVQHHAQATWTARLTCNGKPYDLTITGPGAHTVYRATAPNTPLPATRNALYVETTGNDVSFTTRITAGQ